MSTIDQAFIRAYLHETAPTTAPAPNSDAGTFSADALDVNGQAASQDAWIGIHHGMERGENSVPSPHSKHAPPPAERAHAHVEHDTISVTQVDAPLPSAVQDDIPLPSTNRVDTPPPAEQADTPVGSLPETSTNTPLVDQEAPAREAVLPGFQAVLQVDGFAWSQQATKLRLAAGIQVDRLADRLADGIAEGRKVAGVAGSGRYQGCTTLLLSAAKRLADRGLKLALVDADFAHPAMAARLGILPEAGIEAVLAGRLPLEEVAIESIADRMVVVPLAVPSTDVAHSPQSQSNLADTLDTLADHHDLVLVDLGELGDDADIGDANHASKPLVPGRVDNVVLVQDVRITSPSEILEAVRRLKTSEIARVGVVENFV